MDEGGGGFPHNDNNLIFKSTDGGTPGLTPTPAPLFRAGCHGCRLLRLMFSDNGGYWRHEGWGEPAAFNNVVHLVYAQHGTGADPGDVYYIRSTDSGVTFSAPLKLNTDSTTRPQWQPNLSVSPTGTLFATWYDARESTSCSYGNPAVPCYRMWSRKSNDNGVSWLPDDMFSDVVSPLPAQPDPDIQADLCGRLRLRHRDTHQASHFVDGRARGHQQHIPAGCLHRQGAGRFCRDHHNPACNSIINTQPTGLRCQPERSGGSHDCPGNRLHGKRNSGELVVYTAARNDRSLPLQ